MAHYTDENGLPQNSIKNMNLDSSGYLWLATEAGLVRFDGKNFRLLSKEEMGVRHPRIYLMGRSPFNGALYAFSEENDQVRWSENRGKPVFLPLPPALSEETLSRRYGQSLTPAIRHTSASFTPNLEKQNRRFHILLTATPYSFYILTPDSVTFRTQKKIIWKTKIRQKAGDYFFCQNKRLFLYNRQGFFEEITPQGMSPALQVPGFKKLIQNPGENQFFVITRDNKIYELEQDSAGRLQTVLLMEEFPPDFEISCIIHIQKQILFIGSHMQGLLVCKKHRFKTWAADRPDGQSVFYAISPSDEGGILTSYNDLIDKNGKPVRAGKFPVREMYNRSVSKSKNGNYLICQLDSVLIYSPQNRLLNTLRFNSLATGSLTDRKGRTWITSVDTGVVLLDDNLRPQKRFSFPSRQYVNYIFDFSDDIILLGTRNGLFVLSVNSPHIRPYLPTRGINVRSIFRSSSNRIYLCTYGDGLLMLTPGNIVRFPKDKAGYLNTAHCLLEDNRNRMWITTNKGLFYTHERDFIRYAEGAVSQIYYYYIDKSSGFKTNEFNGGCQPCGLKLGSGELVFPSMNGLVVFNPDSLYVLQPTKKMGIEKVVVDDRPLDHPGDTIRVQRNFKRLEIYLTTPFYGAPENLMYEYSFDSSRTDSWIPIGTADGSLAFTSLPPGYSYICFRQKTRIGLGSFNYQTLVLYKPKAFWELTYFWVFCLLGLSLGLFLAIRLRTRTLKQRNRKLAEAVNVANRELLLTIGKLEKKTRFQQWLTSSVVHDLRGPLRFINFYTGDDIQREGDESSPAQNKFLKSVYFSAVKIYTYTDNLVQLLRMEQVNDFPPQKTDFMELVQDKLEQFREQAAWNGITQELDPDSDPFIYVNKAALSIIIQNLLDNSIKNSKNGHLYLSLKNTEYESVLEIRDDGPGLSEHLLQKFNTPHADEIGRDSGMGLGIWLVKSLVAQTGGRIRFKNLPHKGLSITLTWPIRPE